MDQQHHKHEPSRLRQRRPKPRWWAVGLAGMTGLALTTVGVAAAADAARPFPTSAEDRPGKTADHPGTPDKPATGGHRGKSDEQGKGKKEPKGIPVPCDTDKLIAAITLANARGGATLNLASKCTYLLTAPIDDAGLPDITTPITLNGGKHTVIERAAAVEQFRILTVDTGGDLTLHHLTITGGQTDSDGGGILVNTGGALTTNHSTITRNISGGSGGGIRNNGVATLNHSTVSRNTAVFGGGIFNSGLLTLTKSQVESNNGSEAGGIFSLDSMSATHSVIAHNQASDAGGGLLLGSGTHTLTHTRIVNNTAPQGGGFLINSPGQVTLEKVLLADNTATSQSGGGAAVSNGAFLVVRDSTIKKNTAATNGGGISNSGETVLQQTEVIGNQAGNQGGGINNEATGTLDLIATKVIKNVAVTDGGGIYNDNGTVNLNTATGTIVVKNRPNNCVNVPGCAG